MNDTALRAFGRARIVHPGARARLAVSRDLAREAGDRDGFLARFPSGYGRLIAMAAG